MSPRPVLEEIDPLPGSQAELTIVNGNAEAGIRQHSADMRWGIVAAFQGVPVPGLIFGGDALHEGFQIDAGGGVITLADHQRCAGMLQIKKTHPLADTPGADAGSDSLGEGIQPLTAGVNFEGVFEPIHV